MTNKFFSRLGHRADFQPNIDQAVALGAMLKENTEAGTLSVTWDGQTLIKAIAKDAQTWIVTYNAEFFPVN